MSALTFASCGKYAQITTDKTYSVAAVSCSGQIRYESFRLGARPCDAVFLGFRPTAADARALCEADATAWLGPDATKLRESRRGFPRRRLTTRGPMSCTD